MFLLYNNFNYVAFLISFLHYFLFLKIRSYGYRTTTLKTISKSPNLDYLHRLHLHHAYHILCLPIFLLPHALVPQLTVIHRTSLRPIIQRVLMEWLYLLLFLMSMYYLVGRINMALSHQTHSKSILAKKLNIPRR